MHLCAHSKQTFSPLRGDRAVWAVTQETAARERGTAYYRAYYLHRGATESTSVTVALKGFQHLIAVQA